MDDVIQFEVNYIYFSGVMQFFLSIDKGKCFMNKGNVTLKHANQLEFVFNYVVT